MKFLALFKEEDHRRALLASLIFIMLMTLFFFLVSLKEPNPPLEEEIIEISMPDIIIEFGSQAEGGSSSADEAENPNPDNTMEEPAQDVVTQTEETVSVTTSNGESNSDNTEVSDPEPDSDFSFSGNGTGDGSGTGTEFGNGDGVGGDGNGNTPGDGNASKDRKVTRQPSFDANVQEEGRVAIDIWVDANGNVTRTAFKDSKSNTGSQYLINLAIKAAKTMKYDKKSGVASEYVGYKVFTFTKS